MILTTDDCPPSGLHVVDEHPCIWCVLNLRDNSELLGLREVDSSYNLDISSAIFQISLLEMPRMGFAQQKLDCVSIVQLDIAVVGSHRLNRFST